MPSVNQLAAKLLSVDRPNFTRVGCLAPRLNLFFTDIVIFPFIEEVWDRVKRVVHLFHSRSEPRAIVRANLKVTDYPGETAGATLNQGCD